MRKELTSRQKAILSSITEFMETKGYSPTIREIGEMVHLASSSTVMTHMEKLRKNGYLTWEPKQPRTIQILDKAKTAS